MTEKTDREKFDMAVKFANGRCTAKQYTQGPETGFKRWWSPRVAGKNVRHKIKFPETREQALTEAEAFREACRLHVNSCRHLYS